MKKECQKANNCYNCPVVATYAESVYANMEELRAADVEFMHPFLPLYHDKRLAERLAEVFRQEGLKHKELEAAVQAARTEQLSYKQEIRDMGHKLLQSAGRAWACRSFGRASVSRRSGNQPRFAGDDRLLWFNSHFGRCGCRPAGKP